jgi:adenylate kinase
MNPKILILGPPGAGKGTQSKNIADAFDVDHITTGDALRANKDRDISDMDTEYDTPGEYMDKGELVPDKVVNAMVKEALTSAEGFVLDGYPRNDEQAAELEGMTDLDTVLFVSVPEDELVKRLTGRRVCDDCGTNYHVEYNQPAEEGVCDDCGGELIQREDDTEDVVRDRLDVYHENTEPILDRYSDHEGYVEIDGDQTPDEVWADVEAVIESTMAVGDASSD